MHHFIKVEATKFTEVGYVGKEVDSIIRDLTDSAMKLVSPTRNCEKSLRKQQDAAEDRILDALLPPPKNQWGERGRTTIPIAVLAKRSVKNYVKGSLDDKEIEIDVVSGRVNGRRNHGTSRHGRND